MPWQCNECENEIGEDDLQCPTCEAPKTSWTIIAERTRTFVISGRKFVPRRGEQTGPHSPQDPPYPQEKTLKTDRIRVMPKKDWLALARQGLHPPSEMVLFVRLFPRGHKDLTVKLSVRYAVSEAQELEFPRELPEGLASEAFVDRHFLFVHGAGTVLDQDMSTFPFHVVDITEDTPRGYAPSVHVSALRKRARELPTGPQAPTLGASAGVGAAGDNWLDVKVVTTTGRALGEEPYELVLPDETVQTGRLDAEGVLYLPDTAAGKYRIRFPRLQEH